VAEKTRRTLLAAALVVAGLVMGLLISTYTEMAPQSFADKVPDFWDVPFVELEAKKDSLSGLSQYIEDQKRDLENFKSLLAAVAKRYFTTGWITDILREELDKLPLGKILFNPPTVMKVGKVERVEVRIAQNLEEDLTYALKGRGVPHIESVPVGSFMSVRLSGDDFEILPLNAEQQIITENTFTQWAWDVRPLKSGQRSLHLSVTVRVIIPDVGEEAKDHPVIDRVINVKINPIYSAGKLLQSQWKWLATTTIIPLILWRLNLYSRLKLYSYKRKNRKKRIK